MRNAYLQDNTPVMVGLMGASPDGKGFLAKFENFSVKNIFRSEKIKMVKGKSE